MLPFCRVLKVGGRSIVDRGKSATYPLVDAIAATLANFKLVIATGGGIRSRHVTSIGMDLGLPTGVLAQLRIIDALANAHLLGTLLRHMAWWQFRRKFSDTCCRSSSRRSRP